MSENIGKAVSNGITSKPFTVLIEGNIGSGKTTFLNHFKKYDNICLLTEPVDQWRDLQGHNLLDLMYKDPKKWAMPFQSYVTLTMLNMHMKETSHPVKLMERSIFSARYIFVENMKTMGVLHPAMFAVLEEWYDYINVSNDISVDLIVYLRTSPSVVYHRIKERARTEEQCVPLEYIQQLHDLHEEWLFHQTKFVSPAKVLVLDANLGINEIATEYKRSEVSILQSQYESLQNVLNSPTKCTQRSQV